MLSRGRRLSLKHHFTGRENAMGRVKFSKSEQVIPTAEEAERRPEVEETAKDDEDEDADYEAVGDNADDADGEEADSQEESEADDADDADDSERASPDGHNIDDEMDNREDSGDPEENAGVAQAHLDAIAQPGLLKHLLSKGFLGPKPLHEAARSGDQEHIRSLVQSETIGDEIDETDMFGYTALHMAVEAGYEAITRLLIDAGANIEQMTKLHASRPLHYAAFLGHDAVAKVLLEKKANINAQTDDGRSPLFQAAFRSHPSMVKLLLKAGADRSLVDKDGQTAYEVASDKDVMELLKSPEEDADGEPVTKRIKETK
eukprot:Plantae.Rhodophyta-Rhodochaete_pulchella.ctg1404.p1 GENE.Plantae.Rhodophyta-Rhodochaete_pulchella.ctg1404~~Plantae.Rhodophyta-Rhodochaete_pulchella.ctg1404.p1  ORF type:complete len:317 (-),score=64.49 Plantae.Rhodophyta-Rhodochaete_pulchella.ctg1404:790-1740(-)